MRNALLAALFVLLLCSACSSSTFDDPPHILFADISGVYGADVEQRGLGRLAMSLELVEDTRTVYKAELTNLVDGEQLKLEAIGTLADDHLILNFDRGKTTDFYFESKVSESSEGLYELNGQFIFPDAPPNVPVVFSQPEQAN